MASRAVRGPARTLLRSTAEASDLGRTVCAGGRESGKGLGLHFDANQKGNRVEVGQHPYAAAGVQETGDR